MVFRALVANPSGDYSDAFRRTKLVSQQFTVSAVGADLARNLAALNRQILASTLGEILSRDEIRCLLARRDRILKRAKTFSGGKS